VWPFSEESAAVYSNQQNELEIEGIKGKNVLFLTKFKNGIT